MRRFPGWLVVVLLAAALGAALGWAGSRVASQAAAPEQASTTGATSAWLEDGRATRETTRLLQLLHRANDEGLDPGRYQLADIERELNSPQAVAHARAAAMLSAAYYAYAQDLRVPRTASRTIYVDPDLAPEPPAAGELLASPAPVERLQQLQDHNPLYVDLRAGLRWYRARWSGLPQDQIASGAPLTVGSTGERVGQLRRRLGLPITGGSAQAYDEVVEQAVREFRQVHGLEPSGAADRTVIDALNRGSAHYERVILLNLDRVRGLPVDQPRYLFVDAAGALLQMIEGGRIVDAMRVIVGQPGMETPDLAGRIRFAIFQPSWNVPPDLVRNSIAPAALREGIDYLSRRRFALYPDWQPSAPELNPHDVDWQSVANGEQQVWVRQRPGGDNMMGAVKFMLPNRHGIYLHDTPHKADFARSDRRLSSGCVRVEDARRLARWLFRKEPPMDWDGVPDQRMNLPVPVPVYISYLTAIPEAGEIRFQPDVYSRDQPRLAHRRT